MDSYWLSLGIAVLVKRSIFVEQPADRVRWMQILGIYYHLLGAVAIGQSVSSCGFPLYFIVFFVIWAFMTDLAGRLMIL